MDTSDGRFTQSYRRMDRTQDPYLKWPKGQNNKDKHSMFLFHVDSKYTCSYTYMMWKQTRWERRKRYTERRETDSMRVEEKGRNSLWGQRFSQREEVMGQIRIKYNDTVYENITNPFLYANIPIILKSMLSDFFLDSYTVSLHFWYWLKNC